MEVAIDTNSSYAMVAEHAADALQLDLEDSPEQHCLKIFRCNGTIVSDTSIPTRFGDDPWTWKGYTSLISKYSSQLKMGVGYVYNVSEEISIFLVVCDLLYWHVFHLSLAIYISLDICI